MNTFIGSVELPQPKQDRKRDEHSGLSPAARMAPTLGQAAQALASKPRQLSALGERVKALQLQKDQALEQEQGAGSSGGRQGGRQGGQERPTHSSYYHPVPVGGIALPTPDERSATAQSEDRKRRRGWERGI